MKVEARRNDPCICGSGKKYKKCCMKKSSVIQLHEVKEERFYQQKHMLTLKIKDFVYKKIPVGQQYKLHSEFKRRTEHSLSNKIENQFFDFWLVFFYRYENGLRGIEWFLSDQGKRLSQDEYEMAQNWKSLTPKLLQAVDQDEKSVMFKDMLTNETFPLAKIEENLSGSVAPWSGTFGLIEPFDSFYYFNGVRGIHAPDKLENAIQIVTKLQNEKQLTPEQILMEYYPEVLAAFNTDKNRESTETRNITQYINKYEIVNQQALFDVLQSQQQFLIDKWENQMKVSNWVNSWYQYTDNALTEPIQIGNVIGTLTIEDNALTYITLEEESINELHHILNADIITLSDQQQKTIEVPKTVEMKNTVASLPEGAPQYMLLYANHDVRLDLDIKIPHLNDKSVHDLINEGQIDRVEAYLQQRENNLYTQAQREFGQIEITADFNSVRKELGLPLSPFVTGGAERITTINEFNSATEEKSLVKEEDIPVYELLGFTPATVNTFYSEDLVTFFKEKTDGKSDLTLRKYRNCLFDLREILEGHAVESWDACDENVWKHVCLKDLPSLYDPMSKTVVKDFMSTIKALAKWLVKEGKAATISKAVSNVAKDAEEQLVEYVEGQKVK
ncbi:SEC-C metal-binding domain-containing protein [Metabacillus schmidteae]|uniref:SEC-C metal-binding domain-containing protein n=1 Tax=Metabacillus schmidteae TaxID=2730405 RepID=UPI00158EDA63|nr:SEC-C metal-binding domain-containing protein [Metabacillus schmidteae]